MMESGKYLALRTNKHTHTWIDSVMQQEVMTMEENLKIESKQDGILWGGGVVVDIIQMA